MSQPSGFVPIPFGKVGILLVGIGTVGLIVFALFGQTGWLPVARPIPILSAVLIGIGLYLIFVVPTED